MWKNFRRPWCFVPDKNLKNFGASGILFSKKFNRILRFLRFLALKNKRILGPSSIFFLSIWKNLEWLKLVKKSWELLPLRFRKKFKESRKPLVFYFRKSLKKILRFLSVLVLKNVKKSWSPQVSFFKNLKESSRAQDCGRILGGPDVLFQKKN